MLVYKHMKPEYFFDLIDNGRLYFAKPKIWDNIYETLPIRLMHDDQHWQSTTHLINERVTTKAAPDVVKRLLVLILLFGEDFFYCQCWTKIKESDALWRSYSYDKSSIKIAIDDKYLKDIHNVGGHIVPFDIVYTKGLVTIR